MGINGRLFDSHRSSSPHSHVSSVSVSAKRPREADDEMDTTTSSTKDDHVMRDLSVPTSAATEMPAPAKPVNGIVHVNGNDTDETMIDPASFIQTPAEA